jgi:hypothetical protein
MRRIKKNLFKNLKHTFMLKTVATPQEMDKLVHEKLDKATHKRLYSDLPDPLKQTVYELFAHKNANGELTAKFEAGAPDLRKYLGEEKVKLDAEKAESQKAEDAEAARQKEEQERLNQSMLLLMLGGLVRSFGAMYLKIHFKPEENYKDSMNRIKEFFAELKGRFTVPMLTAHGINDEGKQNSIHNEALIGLMCAIFSVPTYRDRTSSSDANAYAMVATMRYLTHINSIEPLNMDAESVKKLSARKEQILASMAESYANQSGTDIEQVKPIIEKYLPTVISKLHSEII